MGALPVSRLQLTIFMNDRLHIFLSVTILALLVADAGGQNTPEKSTPAVALSPDALDRLVHDLRSPRWSVREAASNALMDAGTSAYRVLRSEFQVATSYEVRRRIKQIALDIYLGEHLGPPHAFLGIQHRGNVGPDSGDSRVPPWASGLLITEVFFGTGASRSGLIRGDLIMALNGRTGTKDFPAIEFTHWIASQRPGVVCVLNVIRGGEGGRLDASVTPGFTPAAFAKARVRAVRHGDDPRVPYEAAGILLEDISDLEGEMRNNNAGFPETGDLLLALDDDPIPLEGALEHFQKWCRGELPAKESAPEPLQAGRAKPAQLRPSAHLLRGGKGLDLEVALGRRPWYLDPAFRQTRGTEPTALEQTLSSFSVWWQDTFDPQGLLSETAEEDPRWELEPRWGGR